MYHVIARGINRQKIFNSRADYNLFMDLIFRYKKESSCEIYAYCLMPNHVHLIIKESAWSVGEIMHRILSVYAARFNKNYDRTGHLFQDRFKSQSIEDDKYFLAALRYIHYNPVNAGLTQKLDKYEFSSFREYIEKEGRLVDIDFALDILGTKNKVEQFRQFHNEYNRNERLDFDERMTEAVLRRLIRNDASFKNDRQKIKEILSLPGVQMAVLSKVSGVPIRTLYNIKNS